MDLSTVCGNMFVTTAYVKPYALLTKPKDSLTTKQAKGNLESCSLKSVGSGPYASHLFYFQSKSFRAISINVSMFFMFVR